MRARRHEDHDPEYIVRRAPTGDAHSDLPMFSGSAPWPETPQVTDAEQRGLALPDSLEAQYAAWRATDDGEAAFVWIAREALGQVARGADRLFIDRLFWDYRNATKRPANNTHRALMARELADTYPTLRPCFEFRERRSA